MRECICSSCRNLKGVVDENGAIDVFECVYGYPSDECNTCETGECELVCSNYINDEEQDKLVVVQCETCGKELHKMCGNDEEGRVQCIDCFFKDRNL